MNPSPAIQPPDRPRALLHWLAQRRSRLSRRRLWGAIGAMLLIGTIASYVLYTLIRDGSLAHAVEQLRERVSLVMLLQASLIYAAILLFTIMVWRQIIGTCIGLWGWWYHIRIYCITTLTKRLPGSIWYLVTRVAIYERAGAARANILVASGFEFATIVLGGLLVALLTWPLVFHNQQISPAWLIAGLVVGLALLNPRLLRFAVRKISRHDLDLVIGYRKMAGWTLQYGLVWCAGGAMLFVLTNMLHPMPLTMLPTIIGVWSTSGVIAFLSSFMPFSLGVTELSITVMLSGYMTTAEGLLIALLMRVVLVFNEVIWGLGVGLIGLLYPGTPLPNEQSFTKLFGSQESLPDAEKPEGLPKPGSVILPK